MDIQETVIQHLATQHGWSTDRILNNWVCKYYDSAVGPKRAALWLTFDAECNQYWLRGEFTSAGQNVLATSYAIIPSTAAENEIQSAVDAFIVEAEKEIEGSYAVRLLLRWPDSAWHSTPM